MKYAHNVQVLTLGYKPKGKAGRFAVSHSWSEAGQPSRYLATTYHATKAAAETYAAKLRHTYREVLNHETL